MTGVMSQGPITYDILRLIWWALLGILLIGFAVLDGYDLGTAMLLPFVGRSDAANAEVNDVREIAAAHSQRHHRRRDDRP